MAAVLLAIGVGGALGALLAAAQLRTRASAREAVAATVEARVAWFGAAACGVAADSVVGSSMGRNYPKPLGGCGSSRHRRSAAT